MSISNFTGYVLAGGKSSRMGCDKAFLETGGQTFLENSVDALKPDCSQIKIVLNKSQTHFIEKLPKDISYIFDIYENRGALGGIHTGLSNCQSEFAVILAVDLPFVTSETIAVLANIALSDKKVSAVVPNQADGRLQPLCAVYRVKDCLPKTEELLNKGNSPSVRDFLKIVPTHYVEFNEMKTDENKDLLFFNVNYSSDYEMFKLSLRLK